MTLAACGGGDEIGERAAEQAIENQLEEQGQSGDVDVDIDDGDINIDTPDGDINVDQDGGNVQIQGESGDVDINFDEGGGVDLPDGFPSEVPLPDGLDIKSASSIDAPEGASYIINGAVDGDLGDATDAYISMLEDAGFTSQMRTDSPEGSVFVFTSDAWSISGGFYADTTDNEGSVANITVVPGGN